MMVESIKMSDLLHARTEAAMSGSLWIDLLQLIPVACANELSLLAAYQQNLLADFGKSASQWQLAVRHML